MPKYIAKIEFKGEEPICGPVVESPNAETVRLIVLLTLVEIEPLLLFVNPKDIPLNIYEVEETNEEQLLSA